MPGIRLTGHLAPDRVEFLGDPCCQKIDVADESHSRPASNVATKSASRSPRSEDRSDTVLDSEDRSEAEAAPMLLRARACSVPFNDWAMSYRTRFRFVIASSLSWIAWAISSIVSRVSGAWSNRSAIAAAIWASVFDEE